DRETFEVLGPGRTPLHRGTREFSWYVRDGLHVRSPVRFDGVTVGDADRRKYEDEWITQERERLDRRAKRAAEKKPGEMAAPTAEPPLSGETPIATPRFVSEAYFMDFKFEAGNYYLAGRESLDGHEVLKVEYYPTRMFDDNDHDRNDPKAEARRKNTTERDRQTEAAIDRKMNKTAMVTLWIDAAEHQIVKYTFDNVWLDFLPGAWLVRVDDIRASMTMSQPFPNIWLPRDMHIHAGVSLAAGPFEATYDRQFANYHLAEVKSIIRVPKLVQGSGFKVQGSQIGVQRSGFRVQGSQSGGPYEPEGEPVEPAEPEEHAPVEPVEPFQSPEVIREIRVHGNASVLDADVISLAGLSLGQAVTADALSAVEARLKQSGKFESVEVRKRYRSLTDASDVAVLLIVHEQPGTFSAGGVIQRRSRPFGRVSDRLMFLPVVNYADGYGLTYGGRVSTIGVLGGGERLSVPLTWGGTRRAALEADRTFTRGPFTRVESSLAIWQRENPHVEIDDRRVEFRARAERRLARVLKAAIQTSRSAVDFGGEDDRLWTLGAEAALDTRADPTFPRNAVYLSTGWTGLHVRSAPVRIDLYTTDARGYAGILGQAVGAVRAQYTTASSRLPDYERLLLGGESTLRGFRAGTFDGDRLLMTSAELRLPLTSVLHNARLGVLGFVDSGKSWDASGRAADSEWHHGIGGGLFFIAPLVRLNLDLAHGLRDGDTRLHVGVGFAF
ncbi:MAG: BamA/TamA family outer membrane protein, partial [Vicinamibacterales bacterium]